MKRYINRNYILVIFAHQDLVLTIHPKNLTGERSVSPCHFYYLLYYRSILSISSINNSLQKIDERKSCGLLPLVLLIALKECTESSHNHKEYTDKQNRSDYSVHFLFFECSFSTLCYPVLSTYLHFFLHIKAFFPLSGDC